MLLALYLGSLWFWVNTGDGFDGQWSHWRLYASAVFIAFSSLLAFMGGFWRSFGMRLEGDPERFILSRIVITLLVILGSAGASLGVLWVYVNIMHRLHDFSAVEVGTRRSGDPSCY